MDAKTTAPDVLSEERARVLLMSLRQNSGNATLLSPEKPKPATPKAGPGSCPCCGFQLGTGMMRPLLPVGHRDFGKLMRCPVCNGGDGSYSRWLREHSGLVGEMAGYHLTAWIADAEREPARQAARAFLANPTGWLTIWSPFGHGKTFLLAAICNELVAHQIHAYYQTVPALLNSLRATFERDGGSRFDFRFEELCQVRVLALDELDKARLTDWARETLFELLDRRYRQASSHGTVIAMNGSPRQLNDDWGYLVSRITDHRFRSVELGGIDVRQIDR